VSSGPGEDESERSADPGDELEFDLGDFLSAPVEEGSPEPVPSAAPTRTRAPRRTPPAQSGSPLLLLAGLALDAVWTAALARDLDAGRPLALVIEAPGANWVQPARHVLAARLGRGAEYVTLTSRPKASTAASPDLDAARAVGSGKMLVAITPDLAWLSPVLVGAADHVLSLPLSRRRRWPRRSRRGRVGRSGA
jgi:hypothetical protein